MKSAVACVALAGLLAAVAAGAAGDGPLSASKQELKELQSDQKRPTEPTAKEGLQASTPSLQMPSQGMPAYTRPTAEQQARAQQQRQTRTNWLLEGVAKLEREAGERKRARLPGEAEDDSAEGLSGTIDRSDPAYLLKLYDQQKGDGPPGAKSAAGPSTRLARPDAFAPFLLDWMAVSPVKDQLIRNLNRQSANGTTLMDSTGEGLSTTPPMTGLPIAANAIRTPSPAATSNPYLDEPQYAMSAPKLAGPPPVLTGSADALTAPTAQASSLPAVPVTLPSPEPRSGDRNAPPTPLADDKKYFPQLNKF